MTPRSRRRQARWRAEGWPVLVEISVVEQRYQEVLAVLIGAPVMEVASRFTSTSVTIQVDAWVLCARAS